MCLLCELPKNKCVCVGPFEFLLKCLNLQKQRHNVYSLMCGLSFSLLLKLMALRLGYLLHQHVFSVVSCSVSISYQIEEQLHVFLAESLVEWFFQADTLFSLKRKQINFSFSFVSTFFHVVVLHVKLFSLAKSSFPLDSFFLSILLWCQKLRIFLI